MEEVPLIRGRRLISYLLIAFSSLIFSCQAVFAEEIEVEISPSIVEISTLPDEFATADQSISVSTTSPTGYLVNFSTTGATTSLTNQNNPSLTIPTFTPSGGGTVVPGSNTGHGYGYSTDGGTFYHPVPLPSGGGNTIFTTVTSGSNTHTLTYGVYPSDSTAAGTYSNAFLITVVANTTGPCQTETICYHGNGDDGTGSMEDQQAASSSSVTLVPPNFSRPGYGFVGWNTESDGTGTDYGPNETITTGDLSGLGMDLYAKWLPATDIIQNWTGCSTMNVGDITALRDMRDNEVYTVAKLADGNCWMTDNLRLNPATASISKSNTNSPTDDFVLRAPASHTTNTMCNSDNSSCVDNIIFNANNTDRNLVASYNANTNAVSWYSYGLNYNWYTATAGNGTYSSQGNSVQGDICPAGWHLPTGNKNGDFWNLNRAINNSSTSSDAKFRKYPNNFLWSGDYNTNITTGRGTQGRYWSATPSSGSNAYRLGNSSTTLTIDKNYNKWAAFAVRCIAKTDNTSLIGDVHYEANGGSGTMSDDESVNFFITQAQANGFTPPGNHIFIEWNTSADGSGTSVLAGDLVGDAASALGLLPGDTLTLYAIWGEESTLSYDVNGGMGNISPATNRSASGTFSFIVSAAVPTRLDYAFAGWSTNPTSQTADYHAGDTFTTTNTTNTLYAVWIVDVCPANSVCYRANGAELGTSLTLTPSSGSVALMGNDYERAGYGFTGWNTEPDGTGTQYGAQQTITISEDLSSGGKSLYANWLASSGNMQTWSSCSALSVGGVVALTDSRDGNTYTIAKLQDGNCWMAENLRLDPSKVTFTAANTNSPTPDFIAAAPTSATSTNLCNQDTADCVNQIAFDANNIDRRLPASPTLNNSSSSWYGYGVWYNWYTATAGNGVRDTVSGDVIGDICPAGWRLPTGGSSNKEYSILNNVLNGGQTRSDANFKNYPANFVYSGDHNARADGGRGSYTRYWSATPENANNSYRFGMTSNSVTPVRSWNKWDAFAVRCIKI